MACTLRCLVAAPNTRCNARAFLSRHALNKHPMPNTRTANAVRLAVAPHSLAGSKLSGAAFTGNWLWLAGDEACGRNRLRRLDPVGPEALRFGEVRDFPLAELVDLSDTAGEEAHLEGMAGADGFLWVVGSHGLKRKNARPDRDHADNAKRLAKAALDGNRRLLACLPVKVDASGELCLARRAQDGRKAMRLKGDAQASLLIRAVADDPHFKPCMAIPGKDSGFDIEGLAVDGRRLLLGLRGPVLHGWSALLEIAAEARGDQLPELEARKSHFFRSRDRCTFRPINTLPPTSHEALDAFRRPRACPVRAGPAVAAGAVQKLGAAAGTGARAHPDPGRAPHTRAGEPASPPGWLRRR